jgi:hypothetical protein
MERTIDQSTGEIIQEDTWDTLCERGRLALEDMDNGRWQIGADACIVRTQYGHDKIADYAREINIEKTRVQEYRTVTKFYGFHEKSARADFCDSHPTLTYSHLRAAMRLKELNRATDLLDEAVNETWTVEQTRIKVSEILGKPVPPDPLVRDVFVRVSAHVGEFGIVFEVPDKDTYNKIVRAWLAGKAKSLLMTLKEDES